MSKAMLIMDMPNGCIECPLCYNEDFPMCEAGGRRIKEDNIEKRQEWCPLKEVPQKKAEFDMDIIHHESLDLGKRIGYNACIDEILGGEENA